MTYVEKSVDNEGDFDRLHKPVPPDKWMFKRMRADDTRLTLCPRCANIIDRSFLLRKGWSERQGDDIVRSIGQASFEIKKIYEYNAD